MIFKRISRIRPDLFGDNKPTFLFSRLFLRHISLSIFLF